MTYSLCRTLRQDVRGWIGARYPEKDSFTSGRFDDTVVGLRRMIPAASCELRARLAEENGMSPDQKRIVGAGLFFLFIVFTGFWLSRSGKPYNGILLTIHKLISVAAVIFFGITIYQVNQAAALGAIELTAVVASGLLFLGTIVSGGLVSAEGPMPTAVWTMHQITPYLTVLSAAATLYLLLRR
jgi:hypothetical protein